MRYRAIVGIKGSSAAKNKRKAEREQIQIDLMRDLLKYWDSSEKVLPYYDPNYDVDKQYSRILKKHANAFPNEINIDDPESVMNYIGASQGRIFFTEVPTHDRKNRDHAIKEYEEKVAEFKKKHKKIPPELKEEYKHELVEPKCGEKTGLYSYSVVNPNGMFSSYQYPLENLYHPFIKEVEAAKLLNHNFGTMHDILKLGDLDFGGTFFPHVVFRNDGEVLESYPDYDHEKDVDPGGDPEEIKAFLEETLGREDYVAIIECVI